MAVEMFSWPSLHERMCRMWGSNSGPLACQANSLPIELLRPVSTFPVMEKTYADSWSDKAQPSDMNLWVMKWRSVWPLFHGSVILPCILKTIWCMYIRLWEYEYWPQNKCRSLWPIFHGPVIWPYILKVIWCMNSLFGIMNQYDPKFVLKINVGHCDLYFMVQWFCVTAWRLLDVWTSYFGIMGQYDPTFDLKIKVGLCDLYFMVQWFCLIYPTPFDAWVSYFQIMRQCDPNFDFKVNISQHDLYFMV